MIDAELGADRIEDGATLTLNTEPSTELKAGDMIRVLRYGNVVAQFIALPEPGEFSWNPSAWMEFLIRIERSADNRARIWLRPHHLDLLTRMRISGYGDEKVLATNSIAIAGSSHSDSARSVEPAT